MLTSWFFYAWWDPRLLVLLLTSISINYFSGLSIDRSNTQKQRKKYMLLGVVSSLALLGFFKYFNFFIDSAQSISQLIGLNFSGPALQIILPIGISFYTFLGLSYIIDLYLEKIPVCRNFVTYALYISYFPLLISGPIVSPAKMIPSIENKRTVNLGWIREGLLLILIGLFKKIGVADALSPQIDVAFQNSAVVGGKDLLYSLYLFSIQIYCDFSGYSDIARGVSKLLGIDLIINFNQPYFSHSITEFWRRWHISLSTWFRNYLFYPLEFSRKRQKLLRQESNLLIVFLLTGLWHGANWTFVIWGTLHGIYLIIEKWFANFSKKKFHVKLPTWLQIPINGLRIVLTFNIVAFTWIFFKADNFKNAWSYLTGIFTWRTKGSITTFTENNILQSSILLFVLILIDIFQAHAKDHTVMLKWPWLVRGIAYTVLLIILFVFGGLDVQAPFIYFQF